MSAISIGFLLLVASLFLLYPLFNVSRGRNDSEEQDGAGLDQQGLNVALYREALAQLEQERDSGSLSNEDFVEQESELQRRLLDDNDEAAHVDVNANESAGATAFARFCLFASVVGLVIGSLLIYDYLGAGNQLEITRLSNELFAEQQQAVRENRDPDLVLARELADRLEVHLARDPEDLYSTYLLASTYAQLGDLERAIPLYKTYLLAVPTDEMVLTEYVQMLYLAAGGELTERVRFVVDRALTLNPYNVQVLGLMGMHHYRAAEYDSAVTYWEKMLEVVPPESESYGMLVGAIERARAQKNAPPAAVSPSGQVGGEVVDKPVDKQDSPQ